MKRFFTGLSGLIILVQAGITSVSAQQPTTATFETYAREWQAPASDVQTRAAAGWRPDSATVFTAAGEKSLKLVYGDVVEAFNWEGNRWVPTDYYEYIRLPFSYDTISYSTNYIIYPYPDGDRAISFGFVSGTVGWAYNIIPTYDAKGNPTRIEFHAYEKANPDNSYPAYSFVFSYNEHGQPVSIEGYNGTDLSRKTTYRWDSNGHIRFYETSEKISGQWVITDKYTLNNEGSVLETNTPWLGEKTKEIVKNDGKGNPAVRYYYTLTDGEWELTKYVVFYPNDLTSGEGLADAVAVVSPSSSAWSQHGIIHIRSAHPQQAAVYSLSGAKLYEGRVQAGTTALDGVRLPKGIYIIVLSGGESLKAPVY